jgi:hypothetical protein
MPLRSSSSTSSLSIHQQCTASFIFFHRFAIGEKNLWHGFLQWMVKDEIFDSQEDLFLCRGFDRETECRTKLCTYTSPIYYLPPSFLLNVPTSRDHVHCVDKPIDPLGVGDVLGCPILFTITNILLGVFNTLISIFQFKVRYGMESDLYEIHHLHLVLYVSMVCLPPMCMFSLDYCINCLYPSVLWNRFLQLF